MKISTLVLIGLAVFPRAGFGQYTGCNGQSPTGQLQLGISSLNSTTGLVQVNGVILAPTSQPLNWTWGDGEMTSGFFPQSHTYVDTQRDYLLQVIAHVNTGATDCAQIIIPFQSSKETRVAVNWTSIGPTRINGDDPRVLESGRISALAIFDNNPAIMYTSGGVGGPLTEAGVFKTTDGGSTWVAINSGLNDPIVNTLWVDQTNPNLVLAATESGIFKSVNGGQAWNLTGAFNSASTLISFNGSLFGGTAGGIVQSTDSGSSWSMVQPTSAPVFTMAAGPNTASRVSMTALSC